MGLTAHQAAEHIRVLIYADDPLIRAGIRASVEAFPYTNVIGEVDSLGRAYARAQAGGIDALVASLPPAGDAGELSRLANLGCATVLLAEPDHNGILFRSAKAGVRRFVDKSSSASELGQALKAAALGQAYLSPTFSGVLLDWLDTRILAAGEVTPELARLSQRELQVLEMLGRARSNTEIARLLRVRETTVRSHVSNLLTKLHLQTRLEAVIVGYRLTLFRDSP